MAQITRQKFIYRWTPPALLQYARDIKQRLDSRTDFLCFWKGFDKSSIPAALVDMVESFIANQDFKRVSRYWHYLNAQNLSMLANLGADNYRNSVALNYFTWTTISEEMAGTIIRIAASAGSPHIANIFKTQPGLDLIASLNHNLLVGALFSALSESGGLAHFEEIREEITENIPYVTIDNKKVTQDRMNSLMELQTISKVFNFQPESTIVEIGAGSGRTATCLLSLNPNLKYIIADIPPALFLSSTNLRRLFPERRIAVGFREKNSAALEKLIDENDLIFIFPSQLSLLRPKSVDLFLAIDCLHEMTKKTIDGYFDEIDRLAKRFYMKVWNHTRVPFDLHELDKNDFPIKKHWTVALDQPCIFPASFSEMGYHLP